MPKELAPLLVHAYFLIQWDLLRVAVESVHLFLLLVPQVLSVNFSIYDSLMGLNQQVVIILKDLISVEGKRLKTLNR